MNPRPSPTPATPTPSLFASRGLGEHALRGVIGLVALQQAMALSAGKPFQSLVMAGVALLAFRGCPICWTIGLVETGYHQVKRIAARVARR